MITFSKSALAALVIAASVQCLTLGLAPRLPREVLRPAVQETRHLTFPAFRLLRIRNVDGAIVVNTHDRNEIILSADIRAYTTSGESRHIAVEYLNALLDIQEEPETLIIETEPAERPEEVGLRVDYTITAPRGTNIDAKCINGNIWISGGCGRIAVDGTLSDIDIYNPEGPVIARSRIGRIAVSGVLHRTELETVNGSINANLAGGQLRASTVNGSIYTALQSPDIESCDLTVMNGGITLVMSEGCTADVNATTGRGAVTSDLPVTHPPGIVPRRKTLRGLIGSGHTELIMNSMNGNIWITRSKT
jgi:hypothetical protein